MPDIVKKESSKQELQITHYDNHKEPDGSLTVSFKAAGLANRVSSIYGLKWWHNSITMCKSWRQ
ncbi:MAG: hypothetical protein WAM14_25865 [Candidatus Nitrosopolaris sp.]